MIVKNVEPDLIPAVIAEFLGKKNDGNCNPLFVFSTDVAVDSWTEWAVRNPVESGTTAVALQDFTAWDKFKGSYLAGNQIGKSCIPSLLRKLYARALIHQNIQSQFIKKIIPSDSADGAFAFTDWLAKILPSLNLWYKKYTSYLQKNNLTEQTDPDTENQDYNQIFTRYNDFLEKNNFFEPSWLVPEFLEKNRTIIIFYPELIEDFCDYEDVLSDAQNVVVVKLPSENQAKNHQVFAYKYQDSRKELRHTILRLRKLHEQGVKWTEMAVSVPDLEIYRPYIQREFDLYCVPVNIRAGEPLTKNCAGLIFNQLNDCVSSNFSYNSVRAILQNEYVPWKNEIKILKENLIREGNRLRAICSYQKDENSTENVDSWIEALSAIPEDYRELEFYKSLKNEIKRICEASTFSAIRTAWLIFRQKFLESQSFTGQANQILSRCISELDDLIDIENRFLIPLELNAQKPFAFFLNELNSKSYRPQEVLNGVSVFPYRVSAQAFFKVQLVIDSSQKNLDVPFKKLGFLNTEKRKLFLGADVDQNAQSSAAYVRLYAKNNSQVNFSYAEESFAGFAIAHNSLSVIEPDSTDELEKSDFIKNERDRLFASNLELKNDDLLSEAQKSAFENWATRTKNFESILDEEPTEPLLEKINQYLVKNRKSGDQIVVTQTDLAKFYPCPRKWLLSSILKLKEDTLDTNLMQIFDMGNINHKILELFTKELASKNECLPITNDDGLFQNEDEIRKKILDYTKLAVHDSKMDFKNSPIVLRALDSQLSLIADGIMNFLHYFCVEPNIPEPEKINSRSSISGFGGYQVVGAEVEIASVVNDVHVFGKIDCLLCSSEGEYVIIDYKNTTGAMPDSAEISADDYGLLGDFQMPMYITLVKNEKIPEGSTIKVEAAYFYAIKDAGKRVCALDEFKGLTKSAPPDTPNLKKYDDFCKITIPLFNNYTQDFVQRVKTARFEPITPKNQMEHFVHVEPYKVCAACNFKTICRTTFTVGEKELKKED